MAVGSRPRIRARTVKGLAMTFCFCLTYFMLRLATTSNRVQRDEIIVVTDIIYVVEYGFLPEPAGYGAGNGYAVLSGVILELLGAGNPALEYLSPVIGAIVVTALTGIVVAIVREVSPDVGQWVAFSVPLSAFVFAAFTHRIAESTHKKFTFTLAFTALLVAFIHYRKNMTDVRWRVLFVGVVSSIAVFNYVWTIIYGMVAILAQLPTSIDRDRALLAGGIPLVVAYVLPVTLPTTRLNIYYTTYFISLFQGQEGGGQRLIETGGISAWPTVTIGGVSFSSWFVFSSGVFVVAAIAGLAGLYALYRYRRCSPPFASFYVVLGTWFALLVGIMLGAGDIATFRRLLVIPGTIGVAYALYVLSSTDILTERRKNVLMASILVVLFVGSMLAIPRAVLDGGTAPYDYYAEENEVHKFEWWNEYAPLENCLNTHQFVDLTASQMVWGLDRPGRAVATPYDPTMDVVYRSGTEAFLSCTKNPPVEAST